MGIRLHVVLSSALLSALFIACGGKEEPPSPTLTGEVHVHLDEWSVQPEPASIDGPVTVTFEGHNHGEFPHQVVVIRTDDAPDALPMERGKVDVDDAGEEMLSFDVPAADPDAGVEGRQVGTVDLRPGRYVIICNIAGHYQQGMRAAFEVREVGE
ncbi:MAG TPA: hypothetical protein VNM43_08315 [Dehalococcoidia bacterium]|nr:hypothetical protein [Dehalococcoidia bacterium]